VRKKNGDAVLRESGRQLVYRETVVVQKYRYYLRIMSDYFSSYTSII